ncbi:MAG TPA: hypothetical protein VG738_15205 [Chitinophagaceae bacterium]|nr:hypothetical protein [Chitinophagaceae bacterium]
MAEWNEFYAAAAGASAVLLGLIFVGISINLKAVLSVPGLDKRASIALILLLGVVTISLLMLLPGEATKRRGYILIAGSLFWAMSTFFDAGVYRSKPKKFKPLYLNFILNQLSFLPYMIGGTISLAGNENGFYRAAAAMILAVIKAVIDAWVLLGKLPGKIICNQPHNKKICRKHLHTVLIAMQI